MLEMLTEKRETAWSEAKSILDRAAAEKRELSSAEERAYQVLVEDMNSLRGGISKLTESEAQNRTVEATMRSISGRPRDSRFVDASGHTEVRYGAPLPAGRSFAELPDARSTGDERRALGEYVANLVERRGQNIGTGSAGGFLVPTPIAATILQATVARCRTVEAGATIIPMDRETLTIPSVDVLPSLSWRAESSAVPESTATFGRVQFAAKTAAAMIRVSIEALEDIDNFSSTLETTLAQAAAVEVDRVGLYGSGASNQPNGLKNILATAGNVTSMGTNGAAASWDNIIAANALVEGRAYDPTAVLLSTRTEAALGGLKDSQGRYIEPPSYLSDVKVLGAPGLPSNQTVGTSNVTADMFVGDFRYLAYGMRTAVSIRVLDQLYAATGEFGILAWLRLDVAALRAGAFQAVTGVTN
jgi:HK97 family phage major capsid protein